MVNQGFRRRYISTDRVSLRSWKRHLSTFPLGTRGIEEITGGATVKFLSGVAGNHLLKVKAQVMM